jgi:hypothetical protein
MKWCEEFARRFEDGRRQLARAAESFPLRFCARNDHTGAERLRYKPLILFILCATHIATASFGRGVFSVGARQQGQLAARASIKNSRGYASATNTLAARSALETATTLTGIAVCAMVVMSSQLTS